MRVLHSGRRMKEQLFAKERHYRYLYPTWVDYPFSVLPFLHSVISFSELSPPIWCLAKETLPKVSDDC